MVNYFIYAKDFSGSTQNESFFHKNGLVSVSQFKSDVEKIQEELLSAGEPPTESKIIYLHWGDKCYEVDENITVLAYNQRESGHMGTDPQTIIRWIQENYDICGENNKIKLLYIITDGLIDHRRAEVCFELNKNIFYEKVVFHAFNQDNRYVDLSVAASFFKSRCMVYRNYDLFDNIDISSEFDYDKINASNFAAEKDNLVSYIKLKFIKTLKYDLHALQEIEKLKKLRNRLFDELTPKKTEVNLHGCKLSNLDTKDREVFLRVFACTDWYKNLYATIVHEAKVDVEKSISTLINYIVSDTKSYSFDALKFDKNFDKSVEEEPMVNINVKFTAEQEIEFPDIILDDEKGIPVVILTNLNLLEKLIFHVTKESDYVSPASFSKFKSAMECPLFLVNDPDISESIGYFYTFNVYKELLKHNRMTEPRTRKPFYGGLVLTDTNLFDKYNDYILSATYFDFKKVFYNVGLFYYVLWKNCENKQWMDKNVVEHFKKYAMRRISETVCKIGLSSLPLDPQEKTSLPTALWYCIEMSSCLFKNDPQNFMQERLRMYYGVAHFMIEILKHFDYDLDLESIKKRIDLIRHVQILKKIQGRRNKVYYLLERIFKNVNVFLTNEIENPFNINTLNYLKLDHKGMLRDDVIEEKVHLNDYVHLMYFGDHSSGAKAGEGKVEISKNTFRPFFMIDKNKSFYSELFKNTKKVVINDDGDIHNIKLTYEAIDSLEFDRILSLYKLFIDCVKDLEKYPTLCEYLEYISNRKKFNADLVTIFPSYVYIKAEEVYEKYQNIVTTVDVTQFIKVSKASVERTERIKAEGRVNFNNDDEMNNFIISEELKVNLKRKQT